MNQSQRKFLNDRVEANRKKILKEINETVPKHPELDKYILQQVMSNAFVMKDPDEIRKALIAFSIDCFKDRNSITNRSGGRWDANGRLCIQIPLEGFMDFPEEYLKDKAAYDKAEKIASVQRDAINKQCDGMITRITLASPAMLQQIIQEVDSMGSLSIKDLQAKPLGKAELRLALAAVDNANQWKQLGSSSEEEED